MDTPEPMDPALYAEMLLAEWQIRFQNAATELEDRYSRETASKLITLACEWTGVEHVSDSLTLEQYQTLTRYIAAIINAGAK